MAKRETVTFRGNAYYRYPDAKRPSDRIYFKNFGKGGYLHRVVWKFYNGDIPEGYQVHHIDGDPANNKIDNLTLVKHGEHIRKYHPLSDEQKEVLRIRLQEVCHQGGEWTKTPEGREFQRKKANELWERVEYREYSCIQCGKLFKSRDLKNEKHIKFCSNPCKSAYRRKLGVDNETRYCTECGKEFIINKYNKKAHCCSSECYQAEKKRH